MIAIHDRKNSFSDRWISLCNARRLDYVCVDMFSNDLFDRLRNINANMLLCHPPMYNRASTLAASSIITACKSAGIAVFPSHEDYWHFDDKIAQKYLFEAAGIQTPKTAVLLDKDSAFDYLEECDYPVVFKLKSGAGSINVELLNSKNEAKKRIGVMFGKGLPATDGAIKDLTTKVRAHQVNRDWPATLKRLPNTLLTLVRLRQEIARERGYFYLQEFIPNNDHDTRVTVIGDRAFAFRRMVRPGDFRASGSKLIDFDPRDIDSGCIKMAFEAAKRLGTNCIAFDFIRRPTDMSLVIIEMSFGFNPDAIFKCPGHWRNGMIWSDGQMWPQDAILDDFLEVNHE